MNDKKICFIICVNNNLYFEQCLFYINNLIIPDGYDIDVISIESGESITSAYNQAMIESDAKYKVYMHQDTFIINRNFINDILNVFNMSEEIGMIGMVGAKTIPLDGCWWNSKNCCGTVYENSTGIMNKLQFENFDEDYSEVKAIDGLLMCTQHDVKWREDLFDGWHLYDTSQSLEFIRNGYKVVVPNMKEPWIVHDCGIVKYSGGNYKGYKDILLEEYKEEIYPLVSVLIPTYNRPDYFKIALDSVINQTYPNIEIIIGDDSTNDDTEAIVKQYIKKYTNIKYYHNKNNLGQFDNDLKLVSLSNGRYINFLMDDDVFDSLKIEKMMSCFIEDINEEISIVTSNRAIIDKDGNVKNIYLSQEEINKITNRIINGEQISQYMLKKNSNIIGEPTTALFDKNKMKEPFGCFCGRKYICNVDLATWFSLLENNKAVIISDCLSYFRIHEGQQLNEEKNIIGGALDYFHSLICNRDKGVFKDDINYSIALNKCYRYSNYVLGLFDNIDVKNNIKEMKQELDRIKEKTPLVSIVIPTHNRTEYLEQSLNCAANQSYPNIEVIIGDNSDNDDSKNMVKEKFLSKYNNITYIDNEGKMGQYENFDNLINKSSGEYLNILMDDDLIDPLKIEKMLKYYMEDEEITLVTSYRIVIDKDSNIIEGNYNFNTPIVEKSEVLDGKQVGDMLLKRLVNFIGEPSTVLMKIRNEKRGKRFFKGYGYYNDEKYYPLADVAMWLDCCSKGKVAYILEPLNYFRYHEEQDQKNVKTHLQGIKEWYKLIEQSYTEGFFINDKETYFYCLKNWLNLAQVAYSINDKEANDVINLINNVKAKVDGGKL